MPQATQVRTMFRTAARYLTEPHPFARNPVMQAPHAVPWGVYGRKLGRTATFVVPTGLIILGWPLAAGAFFNKVGV
ncbi:hypothetical protein BU26DRAFT_300109 [Trematosphaeria pertusa]|uniref:Uncharacterized protein n=1 Tax=Trematosphaeria pertusa TaxID=390896 RepID=A0A6A6IJU2_9PLEO|nr:uncharacterized protein BU26DRAFT_300109 [Trematosphaeria pertusa]KAF2250338.1 hypothetical protein BU26DRAFT_300109 [Trematosphaeria pertusa]